jgi:hypothetical protein
VQASDELELSAVVRTKKPMRSFAFGAAVAPHAAASAVKDGLLSTPHAVAGEACAVFVALANNTVHHYALQEELESGDSGSGTGAGSGSGSSGSSGGVGGGGGGGGGDDDDDDNDDDDRETTSGGGVGGSATAAAAAAGGGGAANLVHRWGYRRVNSLSIPGHQSSVRALDLSSDDSLIASATSGEVKVWNVHRGECVRTMESGFGKWEDR